MKLLVLLAVLVLLSSIADFAAENQQQVEEPSSLFAAELRPVGETEYRVVIEDNNNTKVVRRRLAPYELCLLCKCCAGNTTNCITLPCCFGIDCQLPNKPFGVCAFLPKTCNCTSCASK